MTPRQHALLTFLHDRQATGGAMPSFNEMRSHLGLASKSGIFRLLTALEADGYVRRTPSRARCIEVLRYPVSGGLTANEMKWCAEHADLVRGLMERGAG